MAWRLVDLCKSGNLPAVCAHLDTSPADLETRDIATNTPLHMAADCGFLPIAEELISRGAIVDSHKRDRATPLYLACENGHLDVVQYLIRKGADPSMRRCCGATPCYIACQQGHLEVIEYLVNVCKIDFNSVKLDNASPLYIACQNGYISCAKFLISKGANIKQTRECGATPLFIVCEFGYNDLAELLLAECPEIVNQPRNDGWTPLHAAAHTNQHQIFDTLLKYKADINLRSMRGETPLVLAVKSMKCNTIRCLLERGANLNIEDNEGKTAKDHFAGSDAISALLENAEVIHNN